MPIRFPVDIVSRPSLPVGGRLSHPGPRRDGSGFRAGRARRRKEWIMAGEGNWYDLRVYVGNIGRYNEGSLVGGWATLPMGRDDLDAFLRDRVGIDGERYEEYRIDDFDLPDWLPAGPGERVVDERTSLEDLNVMAGVLSTLDEDDAAKARIWIEEGMSPAGRLSPLVFANVALQADDIPFYAYEAGTRFDPGVSSNEEAFALTVAENDPELAEALDGRFGPYLDLEAIGRDLAMDCTLHDDGYLDRSVDPGIDPELYSRDELVCLAGLDVGDDDACVMSGLDVPMDKAVVR
ncbi:antirestriction protein ArdA [Bifidobacterium adolescentis]|uniref:antirestriction protein ArdA n=1 Tax=Bifidobacterium adolescentis TaxID=1680 RepID=UPI002B4BA2DF|nr:antirestriction protein ArdA [Bifidobacterium adolescentis]